MEMKLVIIIGFSYLYGFFEVFLNLRQRNKVSVTASSDKMSLWLLYGLITIGYILSFSIGATKMGRIYYWDTFFAIGISLVIIGLIIRITSIMTLKQYFTYSVAKVENHKLIETGLYEVIRHWLFRSIDDLCWNFDFFIELVFNSIDDDTDHHWIRLPNKSRRKFSG